MKKFIIGIVLAFGLFSCTKTELTPFQPAKQQQTASVQQTGFITIIDSVSATGAFDTAVALDSVQVPYVVDSVVYDTLYTTNPTTGQTKQIGTEVHAYLTVDATGIAYDASYYTNDGIHYYLGGQLIYTNSNIGMAIGSFPASEKVTQIDLLWPTTGEPLDLSTIHLIAN